MEEFYVMNDIQIKKILDEEERGSWMMDIIYCVLFLGWFDMILIVYLFGLELYMSFDWDLKVKLSILVHGINKIFHFFTNLRRSPNFDEEIYWAQDIKDVNESLKILWLHMRLH